MNEQMNLNKQYANERQEQIDAWHSMDDRLLSEYMERDNSGKGWVCPLCGSGRGPHGTGITRERDSKGIWRYRCWACGGIKNADIIDLMAAANGLNLETATDKDKMDNMRRLTGYISRSDIKPNKITFDPETPVTGVTEPRAERKNYGDYIKAARKNLEEGKGVEYLTIRGITLESAEKWSLGYSVDEHGTERIIVPMDNGTSCFGRAIDDSAVIPKRNFGNADISNGKALERLKKANSPVFVAEGVFDAIALEQAGAGAVVALNSLNNAQRFFDALSAVCKYSRARSAVILAFDRDLAAEAHAITYKKRLKEMGVPVLVARLPDVGANESGKTDPNQIWLADPDALRQYVADAARKANDLCCTRYNAEHRALEFMPKFVAYCQKQKEPTRTGFKCLDIMLGGGLYPGQLITLGAISSLGKTSFLLQAANQIALNGGDVLLFSLEMSKEELIAKSLSWLTANFEQDNGRGGLKRSYRQILNGYKLTGDQREEFNKEELEVIQKSINVYCYRIAPHIYIYSAAEQEKLCMTAEDIRMKVKEYMAEKGQKPALIAIDYLQIVQPSDILMDDKRATDEAVRTFKNIAVELDTPLVVISSFNRANYSVGAAFEAFKQSGLIEYSSDVVLGLQLEGAGRESMEEVNAKKSLKPRPIELVILKNRSAGLTEKPIGYAFDPVGNQFNEEQAYFDNLKQYRAGKEKKDEDKERRKELRKEREKKQLRELKQENKAAEDEAAGKPKLYKPERELYPMISTDAEPDK